MFNKQYSLIASVLTTLFSQHTFANDDVATDLPTVVVQEKALTANSKLLSGGNKETLSNQSSSLIKHLNSTRSASLGETVSQTAGVQNDGFGPNNGWPQIRSLSASRVALTENGLGVSNLGAISPNLPIAIEPFAAKEITVYKSSAAVLFGGNAIGGAVNVDTGLIPKTLPEKDISGSIELSGGSNTPFHQLFSLDGKSHRFAWHIDGGHSKISGYRIPGNSKAAVCYDREALHDGKNTPLARACQVNLHIDEFFDKRGWQYVDPSYLAYGNDYLSENDLGLGDVYKNNPASWLVPNPDYVAGLPGKGEHFVGATDKVPTQKGKMTNSHTERQNISTGISYIGNNGNYLGVGFQHFSTEYGVPGYASLATYTQGNNALKPVNIKTDQNRFHLEGLYRFQEHPYLDNIQFQAALNQTKNKEYLGDVFANSMNSKQSQVRLELNHHFNKIARGVVGFDLSSQRITGEGEDRYLPNNRMNQYGFFALQKFSFPYWDAHFGYRHEWIKNSVDFTNYQAAQGEHEIKKRFSKTHSDFHLNDGFAEIRLKPNELFTFSTRYSRSQRAPQANELYASNRHFAILTDEHGDPNLRAETANTWEFGGELNWDNTRVLANYYQTAFQDYLYLGATGISNAGLERKEWRQNDTRIHGFELELNHTISLGKYGILDTRLFADWVKNSPMEKIQHADPADLKAWQKYMRWYADGDYMPNMPTSRYGLGLSWQKGRWKIGSSLTHYQKQKYASGHVNMRDFSLPSYTLWDAYIGYTHAWGKNALEWFLDGRNLNNTEARPSNAILKYLTPLPARSVRAGLRFSF